LKEFYISTKFIADVGVNLFLYAYEFSVSVIIAAGIYIEVELKTVMIFKNVFYLSKLLLLLFIKEIKYRFEGPNIRNFDSPLPFELDSFKVHSMGNSIYLKFYFPGFVLNIENVEFIEVQSRLEYLLSLFYSEFCRKGGGDEERMLVLFFERVCCSFFSNLPIVL
jgi:hypothetical protein